MARRRTPNGNVIVVSYDRLGRKTGLNDPDLGVMQYAVDPPGRTWAQNSAMLRAAGKTTYMEFDLLGRMTGRYERDLESHWTFDTAVNGVGQLAEAYTMAGAVKDYRRSHAYDSVGRPSVTTQTLSDGVYSSAQEYDAWGRVVTTTHRRGASAAKVFSTRYNAYGYVARIERGNLALWQATAWDAANRASGIKLGNGLSQSRLFNPYSDRLDNATLTTPAGVARLQEGYTFDSLGNVTQRTQYWDGRGFIEDFAYDTLNQP